MARHYLPCLPFWVTLGVLVACDPQGGDGPPDAGDPGTDWTPAGEIAECPHTFRPWTAVATEPVDQGERWIVTQVALGAETDISIVGPETQIPEFHDCQRLVGANGAYGTLAAVFGSTSLDSLNIVDRLGLTVADTTLAQAVAIIYSYDSTYTPLHLEREFNCLYMSGPVVYVRPIGADESECALGGQVARSEFADSLELRVLGDGDTDSFPPVARWDWDADSGYHTIGLGCGGYWCEIGPWNFSTSPVLQGTNLPSVDAKGWYDQQTLAVVRPWGLDPGPATGTIVPVPRLDTLSEGHFDAVARGESNPWTEVAAISLQNDDGTYTAKLGLVVTAADDYANAIFLCKGRASACGVPGGVGETDGDDHWWARIRNSSHDRYFSVIRRPHTGIEVPGTTRWRWQADDETIWIRCGLGCCEVQED